MLRKFKRMCSFLFGSNDRDIEGRRLIYKMRKLYIKGGRINYARSRRVANKLRLRYGCTFWPEMELGKDVYVAHMHNILIGRTASIGDRCKIYPGVYIVSSLKEEVPSSGVLRRHAIVGSDCILGAGCIVVGAVEIGDDVTIGAGAIVTKNIPAHSIVINTNQIISKANQSSGGMES